MIPAELQQPILDRAGGNPLYAEEFVRLLKDKDLLVKKGSSWELREGAEVPFPDSVQALIAARLDTLAPDAKSMLADAAVIGKVFWAGAVAAMGDRDLAEVTETLRELSRKELVRPARRSSIEGEAEYAFWHVLARDVAYAQLPRASRASRHVAAATWIESKAPERVEDLADVLAYHYATALELARAAGQTEQAAELEAPALRFLTLAGERALGLDTAAALSNFERALALAPPGHPERPEALARFGEAAFQAGRSAEAAEALEEAIASFRARVRSPPPPGRWPRSAACSSGSGIPRLDAPGGGAGAPGAARARARARRCAHRGGPRRGPRGEVRGRIRIAERALALAEELGLARPARALGFRGLARANLGDPGGLRGLCARRSRSRPRPGRDARRPCSTTTSGWNSGRSKAPAASLEVMRDGIAFARARGLTEMSMASRRACSSPLVDTGELDEALEVAAEIDRAPRGERRRVGPIGCPRRAGPDPGPARTGREAAGWLDWLESTARETGDPEFVVLGLRHRPPSPAPRSDRTRPRPRCSPRSRRYPGPAKRGTTPSSSPRWCAQRWRSVTRTRRAARGRTRVPLPLRRARPRRGERRPGRGPRGLQAAADAYADAAERWERFGVVPEQAFALLGQGRCLVGLSRPTEAAPVLQQAREIFERLQAAPALAETDALLQQATALSS